MNISVFGPLNFEEPSLRCSKLCLGMPQEEDALTAALNIQVPSLGGIKQRKSMVILNDFQYNSALLGLIT